MGGRGKGGGGRSPCCDKSKVKKGPWSPAEDLSLVSFIQKHGHPNWRSLPKQAGLVRCGKSCRLRWINYLRPDVKRGNFTPQEELSIIRLHATFGNKWSKIASRLPGRTDNEIKNVWNTHLRKRSAMLMIGVSKSATPSSSSAGSSISDGIDQHQSIMNNPSSQKDRQQVVVQNPKLTGEEEAAGAILVQDIDGPSTPSSTLSCNSGLDKANNRWDAPPRHDETNENNNLEIPWESEVEFWNMLDDIQLHDPRFPNGSWKGKETEVECWVRLLEHELGLVDPTAAADETKTMEEVGYINPDEIWCKTSDQISPLWPAGSPQDFGF